MPGIGVLYGKLQQGVQENEQILTISRMRAEAEELYGQRLGEIEGVTNRIDGGFQRDEGATIKKAYEGVRTEMSEAARNHRKIASNIRELVLNPFAKWSDAHAARVRNSQDALHNRVRAHDRQAETVLSYRSAYFNKCRRVEDIEEEDKLAFQEPQATDPSGSPKQPEKSYPSIKVVEEDEDDLEPVDIGDQVYMPEQLKQLLTHALEHVRLGSTKVPILGTYENVTTGAEIVQYIQANMDGSTVADAENIGQDLINKGFLRLIGNMGSTFANSSKMNYQWRSKVFQITGIPEKRPGMLGRTGTVRSADHASAQDSPVIGDRVSEIWSSNWNPLNNPNPTETPAEMLRRETKEADDRYKAAVKRLDILRCELEEAMIEQLKWMERCELDRLKAIKSVILDFSGAIGNVIPSLQSGVDKMMLFQETVQPLGDLRYLLENYKTGNYIPKVVTYENYYKKVDDQTFGIDIEARARADRKRVPLIVTTMLTFLDQRYPDLEGDEARRSIWVVDVPLTNMHLLRNKINTGKPVTMDILEQFDVPVVAGVLKLYLLELPDSLVTSNVYEVIKTMYTSTAQTGSESARIQVIQSTLGGVRLACQATLDALITHFTRLIDLTSADEAYVSLLANVLAPCILRPKERNGLSMAEKFNVRLVRDLFAHKDAIFSELKKQSSLHHANSGSTRSTRAVSTDESKRKEAMEERHRAIAAAQHAQASAGSSRNRQPSPGPSMHKRDRSRGPETRFPISTASVASPSSSTSSHRESLNVPVSPPPTRVLPSTSSPPKSNTSGHTDLPRTNGSLHLPPPAESEAVSGSTNSTLTSRERSATEATTPLANQTRISAALRGSQEPDTPSHTYSQSADTATTTQGSGSTKTLRSKFEVPASTSVSEVSKKDSLGRSRGGFKSRTSQGVTGVEQQEAKEPAGVQLEDKPMDFD